MRAVPDQGRHSTHKLAPRLPGLGFADKSNCFLLRGPVASCRRALFLRAVFRGSAGEYRRGGGRRALRINAQARLCVGDTVQRVALSADGAMVRASTAAPYAGQCLPIEPYEAIALENAKPIACKPAAVRSPRVTKGLDYNLTLGPSAGGDDCGPAGCC